VTTCRKKEHEEGVCPVFFCHTLRTGWQKHPLCDSALTTGHWITIQTRFGPIRLQRARGYCQRCRKWRFPADALLGLPETDMQSPAE
jgi:hypothetical protein